MSYRLLSFAPPFEVSTHDWERPPGREIHLDDPCQEKNSAWNGSYLGSGCSARLPCVGWSRTSSWSKHQWKSPATLIGVKVWSRFFWQSERWHFVLGMRIDGHRFYMTSKCHRVLTVAGAWLQHWFKFRGRGATRLQCAGPKTNMTYVRTVEEEDYERRL